MYKLLGTVVLLGLIGMVQPLVSQSVLAQTDRIDFEIAPKGVDFNYVAPNAADVAAPSIAESSLMSLQSSADKANQNSVAITSLKNVEDAAARPAFWNHLDIIVVAMIALAAVFMRLIMVRQRGSKRSDAIFVETYR